MNITITARMMKQKYDWKEKAGQYEISFDFPDHLIESIDPGNLFKFALEAAYQDWKNKQAEPSEEQP